MRNPRFDFTVKCGVWNSCEVDVTKFPISLAEIFQPDRDLPTVEEFAICDWEKAAQKFNVADRLVVLEGYLAQVVLHPFVHVNNGRPYRDRQLNAGPKIPGETDP